MIATGTVGASPALFSFRRVDRLLVKAEPGLASERFPAFRTNVRFLHSIRIVHSVHVIL